MAMGEDFGCALATGGREIWCWGDNDYRQAADSASGIVNEVAVRVRVADLER